MISDDISWGIYPIRIVFWPAQAHLEGVGCTTLQLPGLLFQEADIKNGPGPFTATLRDPVALVHPSLGLKSGVGFVLNIFESARVILNGMF